MKKLAIVLILPFLFALTACGMEGYKDVSIEEAKQFIDNEEVVILDVRTPQEFQEGHIPNATLLPLQVLEQRLDELNENESYLVVCRSGNRSAQASEILTSSGFKNVYNMTGGMNSWPYEVD